MSETEIEAKRGKLQEPTPDLHIFDLNDDCLISVVSFLEFADLLNLHDVHHPRFHAAIAVNLIHAEVEINPDKYNVKQTDSFLKTFGRTARKINVSQVLYKLDQSAVEELITKYCGEGNVTHFETGTLGFEIRQHFFENNQNFFRSLKSLVILAHMMDSALLCRILDIIDRVQDLTICDVSTFHDFWYFLTKFQSRQLKSLVISFSHEFIENEVHDLPIVESLKTLLFIFHTEVIPADITRFPNIENLDLEASAYSTLNELKELQKLKKLRLHLMKANAVKLNSLLQHLAKQNKLESLWLSLCSIQNEMGEALNYTEDFEIIDHLKQFTKLKSLTLRTQWRFELRLLDLIKPLTELRDLTIFGEELESIDLFELQQLICELPKVAKNLNNIELQFHPKQPANDDFYHRLYGKLLEIKTKQVERSLLSIKMTDSGRPKGNSLCIRTDKLIDLDVDGSCDPSSSSSSSSL